jgi:glucosamine--fructose-6-phosphate aminotransferase (isomerizing)
MEERRGEHTIRSILKQPDTWESTISEMKSKKEEILTLFRGVEHVLFTGCGSNYYMSLSAAFHLQFLCALPARGVPASEIVLFQEGVFDPHVKTLVVVLCRSGETTEVKEAVKKVKQSPWCKTFYIGCYPESSVAKMCDFAVGLSDAHEKSVVTTESFTAMLLAVQIIVGWLSGPDAGKRAEYDDMISSLPETGRRIIHTFHADIRSIPVHTYSQFVFLGSGPFYGIANESMLKMKEMALVPSDAFHALEFRHGPKSILDKDVFVTLFFSDTGLRFERQLLKEIKALGGSAMSVCDRADSTIRDESDHLFEIRSSIPEYARSVLYVPITQLLAFYKALSKKIDVDTPRNLSYYVTI